MCRGDDPSCSEFELHHRQFVEDMARERRAFLASRFAAKGGAATLAAGGLALPKRISPATRHHHLPANADTVHWGYFSKNLKPQLEVESGDFVTIETLTHQASDDHERMIAGDPGAESVYLWTRDRKGVARRGAGEGDGKGLGVHICTGPVLVQGAEPGDVLEVRIVDVTLAAQRQPDVQGPRLRQQRRRQLGLPLQRFPDRRDARGRDDLRARRHRRAQLGARGLQFPLAGGHRSVRREACDDRLSRPAGRPCADDAPLGRAQGRARAGAAAFRRHGPGAQGGRRRELGAAELYRRQHRQLAHRQGRVGLLSGGGAGRAPVGRRSACLAGRFRALRHGHRMLADRHLPAHPAQGSRRLPARRSRASTSR